MKPHFFFLPKTTVRFAKHCNCGYPPFLYQQKKKESPDSLSFLEMRRIASSTVGYCCCRSPFFAAQSRSSSTASSSSSDFVIDIPSSGVHNNNSDPINVTRAVSLETTVGHSEVSRLRIPLQAPRNGIPPPREGSRSAAIATRSHRDMSSRAVEKDLLEDSSGWIEEPNGGDTTTAVEKEPLAYDDEEFAEKILEMEVDGSLDEAWQDAKRAHKEDVVEIVEVLRSMKVKNIVAIDVSGKTSSFDYIINCTCEGPRHIHLAAWAVQEADKHARLSKIKRQQTDHLWEVVPVGRILVNLMQESYRQEVNVERKWVVTKSMDPLAFANAPVSEGRQVRAHGLWTLTLNMQDLEDFEVDYCKDVLISQR